jgi:hypothetical protein
MAHPGSICNNPATRIEYATAERIVLAFGQDRSTSPEQCDNRESAAYNLPVAVPDHLRRPALGQVFPSAHFRQQDRSPLPVWDDS